MCVCVSAGTGTADPPLTPGGVCRALEEEEEEGCGEGYGHNTDRNVPFTEHGGEQLIKN